MHLKIILLFALLSIHHVSSQVNPSLFSRKVDELVEHSLKRNEMQRHLDTLTYEHQSLNGELLVDSLAKTFGRKFDERVSVVKRLQEVVEDAYGGSSSAYECCRFPSGQTEFDSRFKNKIGAGRVCEQISSDAEQSPSKLSSAFQSSCVQNLQTLPSMKWQYFGSEQGVTTQFPALPSNAGCGSYDNRFRPWYVQANVPRPKHVVIVIDKSGSMSNTHNGITLMDLAKEAAKTVISTLNPFDQFAVIAFSSYVETYSGGRNVDSCYADKLAQATPQNKKIISDYVDTINHGGSTFYGIALQQAFAYLENAYDSSLASTTDRVILFLSDGEPTDSTSNIFGALNDGNQALNNTAVVVTFGLGNQNFQVLRDMADRSGGISSGEDATRGVFLPITNPDNLRNEMASYYQYYSTRNRDIEDPIWTVPYLDSWGLGQMITASLPVYSGSLLIGVVAVDVTLQELLAEATYFRPTDLSYSFVINQEGQVINHPLFPYVADHDSLFVSVTALEREPEFQSVFESMKRGESGSKAFNSTRVLSEGDSRKYGVRQITVSSTYFWKQIPRTTFTVCLVLANGDTQSFLASQGSLPLNSFLYHRLDLLSPQSPCTHLNNYCSIDKTSVMLASRAFSDPEYYLSKVFSTNDVERIGAYMEGRGPNTERIKESVKDEVVATYQAESLWTEQNENTDLQRQVVWRYVGTRNGLYRIFPGTQLPDDYDPTLRLWYEHALANRDSRAVTTPYTDAASGAVVVTLSGVLFEGRPNGVHDPNRDEVIGAMGVDMLLTYFYDVLLELYPVCNTTSKCTLIDKAGFVIVAEEFISSQNANTDRHITELEPDVAYHMIRNQVLLQGSCANIENGLLQRTYTISDEQTFLLGKTYGLPCFNYELFPIENTNSLLIVRDRTSTRSGCGFSGRGQCSCNKITGQCNSAWNSLFDCECPCTSVNGNYQPCTNEYHITSASSPPCTPENFELSSVTQNDANQGSLPQCYEVGFVFIPNTGDEESGISTGVIVAIILAIVFVILLGALLVRGHIRKKRSASSNARTTTTTTTMNRSQAQPTSAAQANSAFSFNNAQPTRASAPPLHEASAAPHTPAYNPYYENSIKSGIPEGHPIGGKAFPPSYDMAIGESSSHART